MPSIAIVGAGPSGFYLADALLRARPRWRIDLLERLPVPLGLVRYGVAPDHQGTKAVARQFDRLLRKPGLRLRAGVELGRDASLAELRALYDAVAIATGSTRDRKLAIPGEDLAGVIGSWQLVGWYNGHPDLAASVPALGTVRNAVIIGNGNVAIDVVRVLGKTAAEMSKSDITPAAAAALQAMPLAGLTMIGRRGPVEASFTTVELGELGRLERVVPLIDNTAMPECSGDSDAVRAKIVDANLAVMRGWQPNSAASKPLPLHLMFHTTPIAFHGEAGRLRAVDLQRTGDPQQRWTVPADLVVTCIGYDTSPVAGLPLERGVIANADGRVRDLPGVFVVGWARRGPSGVIATNRADSIAVAERLIGDVEAAASSTKAGGAGLDALLASRKVRTVDAAGWQRIDKAEIAAGQREGRPRIKIVDRTQMLATAMP